MVSLAEIYNTQIKEFANTHLLNFKITESKVHGPFFYTELKDELIKVVIQGDIGGFEVLTFIGDDKYSLWQYDKSVKFKTGTNPENITFQLNILNNLLKSLTT